MNKTTILTISNTEFDYEDPDPSSIEISDIAHSLARVPRFAGHTDPTYYVAQHCVIMSRVVPERLALHALMHDAAEAYTGDIPSPLKALLGESIYEVENRIMYSIWARFGIPPLTAQGKEIIRIWDVKIRHAETRDLRPGVPFFRPAADLFPPIFAWNQRDASVSFLRRFYELKDKIL